MRSSLAVMLMGAFLCTAALATGAPAKSGAWGPQGNNWASIAKLPDWWRGVWQLDWEHRGLAAMRGTPPALTPAAQKRLDEYHKLQKEGLDQQTQTANCVPPGMPQIMTQPYPIQFMYTPGRVTLAIEAYSQMRRIYTDGRKHPPDPDPTFQGHSIGHWEGKTLVVDTVGFIPNSLIAPGIGHSDQMHIIERFRTTSPDTMVIKTTIIDPKVLAKPWTVSRVYVRKNWDLEEYVCLQNNRDSTDAEGRAYINLKRTDK